MPGIHIVTDNQAAMAVIACQLGIANEVGSGPRRHGDNSRHIFVSRPAGQLFCERHAKPSLL